MVAKRKLDGAVNKSSADQDIRKCDAMYITCEKYGGLHLAELGVTAGRQAGRQAVRQTKFGQGLTF